MVMLNVVMAAAGGDVGPMPAIVGGAVLLLALIAFVVARFFGGQAGASPSASQVYAQTLDAVMGWAQMLVRYCEQQKKLGKMTNVEAKVYVIESINKLVMMAPEEVREAYDRIPGFIVNNIVEAAVQIINGEQQAGKIEPQILPFPPGWPPVEKRGG